MDIADEIAQRMIPEAGSEWPILPHARAILVADAARAIRAAIAAQSKMMPLRDAIARSQALSEQHPCLTFDFLVDDQGVLITGHYDVTETEAEDVLVLRRMVLWHEIDTARASLLTDAVDLIAERLFSATVLTAPRRA